MQIQVKNAGLCLLAPFLLDYFKILGLTENERFKSESYRYRSVMLLDYLATGNQLWTASRSSFSVFLSGKNSSRRAGLIPRLTAVEKLESNNLLQSITKQSGVLGSTSIDGFRQSFLTRAGQLSLDSGTFHLVIEKKTIDILLDRLPWSFNSIHLPWMQQTIFVEW